MTSAGLPRQRWMEPIEAFVREHGHQTPRWAVVCTYECNFAVLDRMLLPALSRRGRAFRTLVLTDAGALERRLRNSDGVLEGTVNLHPVAMLARGPFPPKFHPKLVLLRAGDAVCVCFGSANLSHGGFGGNLELWLHTTSPDIVGALTRFLDQCASDPALRVDPVCKRQLERALAGLSRKTSQDVWSSFDESFEKRFARTEARDSSLTIVSPAFAGPLPVRARKAFRQKEVVLYTNAQVKLPGTAVRIYQPPQPQDRDTEIEAGEYPDELHAKLFLVERRGRSAAWVGSANFSAQALVRSVAEGGNVELLVRTPVPPDETAALKTELSELFKDLRDAADVPQPPPELDEPPSGRVLGCEIERAGGGLRLKVHVVPGVTAVVLEYRRKRVTVRPSRGVGVVEGDAFRRFLGDVEADRPSVLVIREIIGSDTVPVVVNVPFVGAPTADRPVAVAIDEMLDELRGRIPGRPPATDSDDDAGNGDDGDSEQDAEVEKRLDEVRHQGELDKLAVKTALLKKLIVAKTAVGILRDTLFEQARAALSGVPYHLRPMLEDYLVK